MRLPDQFHLLKCLCVGTVFFSLHGLSLAQSPDSPAKLVSQPQWIWAEESSDDQQVVFRREFELEGEVKQAVLIATADNHCEVFVNNRKVASADDWAQLASAEISGQLTQGKNTIGIVGRNDGGIAGALLIVRIVRPNGETQEWVSDRSWKTTQSARGAWRSVGFDDSRWSPAKVIGALGAPNLPWTASVSADSIVSALGSGAAGEFVPTHAENVQAVDGFKVEKIFHVPRTMGSWVSLATDPNGRLIASDQGGAGLYLITPGSGSEPTRVERLPVKLSGAQGLLWAFDSLYAVVNGGDQSGLHRLKDTDGDGKVDSDEFCMFVPGGGEHGPHAVVPTPDGKSLMVAAGNHTKLPETLAGSKAPRNWGEDLLLPRRWDANGHAAGILAPGGWICNVDPSGKEWTVFSSGYRNQYDIAFNPEGELFTYDADMEWDFGAPWYRPTRVCHATSGSEFGWRSGTGKWPTYYADSLPPAVEIGPGSPTGIVFGSGAKFPAKYQRALFVLDWTYSTIYSVHLESEGASYRGTKADFVTGTPMPVTDAVIGNDGALYFAVGGRGTQSALYRVTYVGSESTAPATAETAGNDLRKLRHSLEAWHGREGADLDFVFKHLGHPDRFIRFAARIALESQPKDRWIGRALQQTEPQTAIHALLAVARQGSAKEVDAIAQRLMGLNFAKLDSASLLAALRTLEVAFARHGKPSVAVATQLREQLDALYPSAENQLNAELVQLLVYLESPSVVSKTLTLMDRLGPEPIPDWGYLVSRNAGYGGTVGKMLADMPPSRAIHFAFVLRNVSSGWTLDQRKKYFNFFIGAAKHPGGNSYAKFLMQFRDDAYATCTPAEKIVLEPLASQSLIAEAMVATPPKGPGRKWTTADALASVSKELRKRDYQAGRNLFHATSCAKCHRIAGEGGAIGPDLSTAGKKFSLPDLLDAIIEPSKAISDQYGSQQILTVDGKSLVGRAVEIGNEYYVFTADPDAKPVIIPKSEIEQIMPSKLSQMPVGLIDTLNEEELKDLIAYLLAAGDRRDRLYR